MTIYGIPITPEQVAKCEERMRASEFTATQIHSTAIASGVPHSVPSNYNFNRYFPGELLTKRLINHYRKLGNIEQVRRGVWRWIGGKA